MHGPPSDRPPQPDRRISASANAALVLVAALMPLFAAVGTPGPVDHREQRPWGCRTCPIPAETSPAEVRDPWSAQDLGDLF